MGIAAGLLRAPHVGIRDLKENLSRLLKSGDPLVVTERGRPVDVILPYADMMNLIDIIDEMTDTETLATVMDGKKAIASGARGVSATRLFRKMKVAMR